MNLEITNPCNVRTASSSVLPKAAMPLPDEEVAGILSLCPAWMAKPEVLCAQYAWEIVTPVQTSLAHCSLGVGTACLPLSHQAVNLCILSKLVKELAYNWPEFLPLLSKEVYCGVLIIYLVKICRVLYCTVKHRAECRGLENVHAFLSRLKGNSLTVL